MGAGGGRVWVRLDGVQVGGHCATQAWFSREEVVAGCGGNTVPSDHVPGIMRTLPILNSSHLILVEGRNLKIMP